MSSLACSNQDPNNDPLRSRPISLPGASFAHKRFSVCALGQNFARWECCSSEQRASLLCEGRWHRERRGGNVRVWAVSRRARVRACVGLLGAALVCRARDA